MGRVGRVHSPPSHHQLVRNSWLHSSLASGTLGWPKWIQNSPWMSIWRQFWVPRRAKMVLGELCWLHFGSPGGSKSIQNWLLGFQRHQHTNEEASKHPSVGVDHPFGTPKLPKLSLEGPKWSLEGPKIVPKWLQNRSKIDQKSMLSFYRKFDHFLIDL